MDVYIIPLSMPFRWKGREFQIGTVGIKCGVPFATTTPHDDALVEEIKRRVLVDHGLKLYLGHGYACFAEDYKSEGN